MSVMAVWNGLLELLGPSRCAACDELLRAADMRGFCDACDILLEPSRAQRPRAAYLYGGPLADAIRRFKYGGRSELARPLAGLLLPRALELAGEVDAVTSVPLHPRRLRARGFDQAALLARPIARALALPFRPRCARRVRDTPPQVSLEADQRAANVRGAFTARRAPPRVLLVDDVRTTGATLAACAEALRDAGAERVETLVLARAE